MPEAGTCSLLSVTGTCRRERPSRESETEFGIRKVRDKIPGFTLWDLNSLWFIESC